jgi:hypothetical protein
VWLKTLEETSGGPLKKLLEEEISTSVLEGLKRETKTRRHVVHYDWCLSLPL